MAKISVLVVVEPAKMLGDEFCHEHSDAILKSVAAALQSNYGRYLVAEDIFDVQYIDSRDLPGKVLELNDDDDTKAVILFAPGVGLVEREKILHIPCLANAQFDEVNKQAVLAAFSVSIKTLVVSDLDDTALDYEMSRACAETVLNASWVDFMTSHVAPNQNYVFLQMTARAPEDLTKTSRELYEEIARDLTAEGYDTGEARAQFYLQKSVAISAVAAMGAVRRNLPALFLEGATPIQFTSGAYKWVEISRHVLSLPEASRPGRIVLMDDQYAELDPDEGTDGTKAKAELAAMGIELLVLHMRQRGDVVNFDNAKTEVLRFARQYVTAGKPLIVPGIFAQGVGAVVSASASASASALICDEAPGDKRRRKKEDPLEEYAAKRVCKPQK